jgi:hypothetical protein
LSRVITRLWNVSQVTPKVIENLYAADLTYLQDFYNRINRSGKPSFAAVCPQCTHAFDVELQAEGEY